MTPTASQPISPLTFSDRVRLWTKGILDPIAARLQAWGVHPDWITWLGLSVVIIAAVAISQGELLIAAILLLLGLPLDALDGAIARLRYATPNPFGAFLDSTLDRYADGAIFGALIFYGERQDSPLIMLLALIALIGAYAVSYTRARAEGLDLECKIGLFARFERVVVLLLMLLTGWVEIGLLILSIGTQFTGLQRIWHVYRVAPRPQVANPKTIDQT